MEQPIKVLLVDDKQDYCESLSGPARNKNIQIVYKLDWETGFELLKQDPLIEFVILDGKGKIEADQETEKDNFVIRAIDDVKAFSNTTGKHIPFCVNTGFIDSFGALEGNAKVFEKSEEQREKMFDYIIERVSSSELFNLKNKYPNPIMLCTDKYIGSKHFDRILGLIQNIEEPLEIKVPQDMLNPMRKILEALFAKLNSIGLIPDEIIQGQGSINGSSIFLSGRHLSYTYNQPLVHPMVAENIYRLLNLTQDASHNTGSKLEADEYLAKNNTPYLYLSSVYLLLDILNWMKTFIDDNNNKDANIAKWESVSINTAAAPDVSLHGEVSRIAENGWGTFREDNSASEISIPPSMVTSNNLTINQNIEITTKPSPEGTKTFIKEIITT